MNNSANLNIDDFECVLWDSSDILNDPLKWGNELHSIFEKTSKPFTATANDSFKAQLLKNDVTYVVHVDVQGIQKKEVKVQADSAGKSPVLRITGERKEPDPVTDTSEWKGFEQVCNQLGYGKRHVSITLPRDANMDAIGASQKDGVLTLIIPKKENCKGDTLKDIEVK